MSSRSTKAAQEKRSPTDGASPDLRSHGVYECPTCHYRVFADVSSGTSYTSENGTCDGSLILTATGTITSCGQGISRWIETPPAYSVH
jgi:hypothetical protein